jgi:protein-S-isoprenylcysteine O-methyltransferase Ste14
LTVEPAFDVLTGSVRNRTVGGWLLVAAQLGLLGAIFLGPTGRTWPVPAPFRAVLILIGLAGAAMVVWGALALGRQITPHPAPPVEATLRTDGPYRLVRHPIYSGVLGLALGAAGASGGAFKAAALVLLLIVLVIKARFEEKLLAERFPDYPAYASRTPRFLPRIPRPRDSGQ